MQEMSVFWLRAAVALYAVGLFHTDLGRFSKGFLDFPSSTGSI